LKRKSYFVDEHALSRAKKALGVKTEAEVIRLSVERVAEMEEFWEFMKKSRRLIKPEASFTARCHGTTVVTANSSDSNYFEQSFEFQFSRAK
jgi:hypothetical protein